MFKWFEGCIAYRVAGQILGVMFKIGKEIDNTSLISSTYFLQLIPSYCTLVQMSKRLQCLLSKLDIRKVLLLEEMTEDNLGL